MIKFAEAPLVGKVENSKTNTAPDVKCFKCLKKYPIYLDTCPYCSKLNNKQ